MNRTRLLVLLLSLAALVIRGPLAEAESPDPIVRLAPASVQVNAGETVQITVEIEDIANLGAFQFDLTYDPTIVAVESITLGDFPDSTGRNVNPLGPRIEAGKAVYGAFSFGDAAGPAGSGTLAIITLKALAGGETPLGLQNVQVVDVSGTRIPISTAGATVTVSGTAPAPVATTSEPTQAGAATATTSEPTQVSTATAEVALPTPQVDGESSTTSPWIDWAIVAAALIVVVALVTFVARRLAR